MNRDVLRERRGFSLFEGLMLVLIVAVVGISLWWWIAGSVREDQTYAVRHHLSKLRALVQRYRADHHGRFPTQLQHLCEATNGEGRVLATGGSHTDFPWGPYLESLPENPFSQGGALGRRMARLVDNDPPTPADITPGNRGGWLYNSGTGGVWVDHAALADL